MIIRWSLSDIIQASIRDKGNANNFLDAIWEKLKESETETTKINEFFLWTQNMSMWKEHKVLF